MKVLHKSSLHFDQKNDLPFLLPRLGPPTLSTSKIKIQFHPSTSTISIIKKKKELSVGLKDSSSTNHSFLPSLVSLSPASFFLTSLSTGSVHPSDLPFMTFTQSMSPTPTFLTPSVLASLLKSKAPSILPRSDLINRSTLSGAMDVIVIQHPNGKRCATPFYLKFGRFKLLRPYRKPIWLFVGSEWVKLAMWMDKEGMGQFELNEGPPISSLPSEVLALFPLQLGANPLTYVTFNDKNIPVCLHTTIYLWDWQTKCVISDIDGTITKSDVLGVLLPKFFGSSYAHEGVTSLYQKIHQAGYQFIYLSARGMANVLGTKQYISQLEQSECKLPLGPILVSPNGIFHCMKREWQCTSTCFKAQTLLHLAELFHQPGKDIFIAGFGNRISDMEAYTIAGIPKSHQFLVSSSGQIHLTCIQSEFSFFFNTATTNDDNNNPKENKKAKKKETMDDQSYFIEQTKTVITVPRSLPSMSSSDLKTKKTLNFRFLSSLHTLNYRSKIKNYSISSSSSSCKYVPIISHKSLYHHVSHWFPPVAKIPDLTSSSS